MSTESVAAKCLAFSGLFEAELLVELLLRHWGHPLAEDKEFKNNVLEGAVNALRLSCAGASLIEGILAGQMNFVAAIWYVEWSALVSGAEDSSGQRHRWLEAVRRSIPSCFCNQA